MKASARQLLQACCAAALVPFVAADVFAFQAGQRHTLEFKEPTGSAVIEGSVTRAAGGQPIEGATVRLLPIEAPELNPKTLKTDVSGRFAFSNLPAGSYRVLADKDGFVRAEAGARAPGGAGQVSEVRDGESLRTISIAMSAHAILRGSVVGEDDEQLAGVAVLAVRQIHRFGRTRVTPARSGITNRAGDFSITGLPPGRYYLLASPATKDWKSANTASTAVVAHSTYVQRYYPAADSPLAAVPIDVTAGMEVTGLKIELRRDDAVRVAGRVLSDRGAAIGAAVNLFPAEGDFASVARRNAIVQDQLGRFQFEGVRPGAYILTSEWFEGDDRLHAREHVMVARRSIQLDLRLSKATPLRGRVRIEGDDPNVQLPAVAVGLESEEPSPLRSLSSKVEGGGQFIINNVVPGRFLVQVAQLPESLYVRSVRAGDRDWPDMWLDLSGSTAGPLEITLSTSGGRLSGSVLSPGKKASKNALVVLVPEQERRHWVHLHRRATTDEQGAFQLLGGAPGKYGLFAVDPVYQDKLDDPAFMAQMEKRGMSIDVRPNAVQSVELRLHDPE